MSSSHFKRPKLSVDLDDNTLKRLKLSNDDTNPPTSADEENLDQEGLSPLTPLDSPLFNEDSNHTTVDLNDPTSPLTPLEELCGSLQATAIKTSVSKWCRSEENNWLLEDETEAALQGPD